MSILRLHGILKEYRGPLRADFRREYGIDLDAALVPDSPAYVRPAVMLDLIDGLSQQAAYWRAVAPDDAGWGLREQLLAQQIDDFRLFCWEWAEARVNGPSRFHAQGNATVTPSRYK